MKKIKISILCLLAISLLMFIKNNNNSFNKTNEIDKSIIGVYLEDDSGEYIINNSIPSSGYKLNNTKSTCNNNVIPSWSNNELKLNNLVYGTVCYLYFDKLEEITMSEILASKNKSVRTNFSTTLESDTTGTVFTAEDDDGTSYYYAGAVQDNWVKFAGFYWRIIRVNGDGSIRMIYNGPTNSQTGESTTIGKSAFNEKYDDNAYVGFMYTLNEVHGTDNNSIVKKELDKWFINNMTNFSNYVDTSAGFCSDRSSSISNSGSTTDNTGGINTTVTYYGAYLRLKNGGITDNANASYKCIENIDLYTVLGTNKGNRFLTNPIGLITVDEAAYAGGVINKDNKNYYLYTEYNYWTISPSYFGSSGDAVVFRIGGRGDLFSSNASKIANIRPVINLKSDTIFESVKSNKGTANNPYIVKGAE